MKLRVSADVFVELLDGAIELEPVESLRRNKVQTCVYTPHYCVFIIINYKIPARKKICLKTCSFKDHLRNVSFLEMGGYGSNKRY